MKSLISKMHYLISGLAILIVLFVTLESKAHGENLPGPNGGKIRMPGPYHTEVIAHQNGFQVFLLDINFKKPIVSDSQVRARIQTDGQILNLNCETHSNHYFCPVSKIPLSGTLIIDSTRDAVKGNSAEYQLPL